MPHGQLLSEALLGYFNVLINKGDVFVSGDFPAPGVAQNGWFYAIQATVTDPVTGRTFYTGDYVVWNGSDWYIIEAGGTSPGFRIIGPVAIAPGDTEIVDTLDLTKRGTWYFFHVSESLTSNSMVMQVQATHTSGSPGSFNHCVPAEVGDKMRVSTDTSIVGLDLLVKFTNNQHFPVTVIGKAIDL